MASKKKASKKVVRLQVEEPVVEEPTLTFSEKISSGYYHSKLPWAPVQKDPQVAKAYHADCARLSDEFRDDLLADLGLTNHPKADKLYSLAYAYGHSSGYRDV